MVFIEISCGDFLLRHKFVSFTRWRHGSLCDPGREFGICIL